MIRTIELEFYKTRRKKLAIMITLFLVIELLWAFMASSMAIARNPDNASWAPIVFSVATMNGLFMPIATAIVVSRICDMEHKGATWKMLAATNVSRGRLYAAKYICANSLILYGILAQTILILAFGHFKQLPGSLSMEWGIRFIGGTMLTTLAVSALQQWISMAVKNQAFALCLGMLGGFIGLTAGLFPDAVRRCLIWAYYLELNPITFIYAEPASTYMAQPLNAGLAAAAVVMTMLFYFAGNLHIARQEI